MYSLQMCIHLCICVQIQYTVYDATHLISIIINMYNVHIMQLPSHSLIWTNCSVKYNRIFWINRLEKVDFFLNTSYFSACFKICEFLSVSIWICPLLSCVFSTLSVVNFSESKWEWFDNIKFKLQIGNEGKYKWPWFSLVL